MNNSPNQLGKQTAIRAWTPESAEFLSPTSNGIRIEKNATRVPQDLPGEPHGDGLI